VGSKLVVFRVELAIELAPAGILLYRSPMISMVKALLGNFHVHRICHDQLAGVVFGGGSGHRAAAAAPSAVDLVLAVVEPGVVLRPR